jgi:hypothetical protein
MREAVILPITPPERLSHIDAFVVDRMNIGNIPEKRQVQRSSITEEHFNQIYHLQIIRDLRIIIDNPDEKNDLIIGFDMFELMEDTEQNKIE